MLALGFTFQDKEKIVLELQDGRRIELHHFKSPAGARTIGIKAPKDIGIHREPVKK